MLSDALRQYAEAAWREARSAMGGLGARYESAIAVLENEEQILTELALGTLPVSDTAAEDAFPVLLSYVRHALFLRRNVLACSCLPEDIFLHDVFYPRINNETLVDCRPFFYAMLAPLVEGLSASEAILAVNRWCAEQMTYETTDGRTMDPMTAWRCGRGRCGEESTFAVSALRSVGIPARQIYAPWWAHCDDNHAWVEAYADGSWHFLGACEPEPILDRGWFSSASSRAMMTCCRRFFDFTGEALGAEALTQRLGICATYNRTARYARTAALRLTVLNREGKACPGAAVRFYVMNMAAPAQIAALEADTSGAVTLETGLGTMLAEAQAGEWYAWKRIEVTGDREDCIRVQWKTPPAGEWSWDMRAPMASTENLRQLTPEQERVRALVLAGAAAKREKRQAGYWQPAYETAEPELQVILKEASGHAAALWQFWQDCPEAERPMALALLKCLRTKDWKDADPAVLRDHMDRRPDTGGLDAELYSAYVLCPRIGLERLTAWRGPLLGALTEEERQHFTREPEALWDWIAVNFREGACRWQTGLWLTPDAALRLRCADRNGRRLLFTAILRTLGVPARLDPADGRAQYYRDGVFRSAEPVEAGEPEGMLRLQSSEPLCCGQNFSLARWEKGWQLLELPDGPACWRLPAGCYRLVTAVRLPCGDQMDWCTVFTLNAEQDKKVRAELRTAEPGRLLTDYHVSPPPLQDGAGLTLQTGVGRWLLVFAEPDTEPTAHAFNELLENLPAVEAAMRAGMEIAVIIPAGQAQTEQVLGRVRKSLPGVHICTADLRSAAVEELTRGVFLEPGITPLTLLLRDGVCRFARCGYAVGTVPLALKLDGILREQKE